MLQFSDDLIKGQRDPGVTIAQSLWIELSKHILISGTIPAESRIVVRIFFNGRSSLGERVAPKAGKYARQYSKMEEAMIRFAETQPLFDFIDCGGGKERADSKIQGMLSLSQPEFILILFCRKRAPVPQQPRLSRHLPRSLH